MGETIVQKPPLGGFCFAGNPSILDTIALYVLFLFRYIEGYEYEN